MSIFRHIIPLVILLILIPFSAGYAEDDPASGELQKACSEVRKQIVTARENLLKAREEIAAERAALRARIIETESELESAGRALEAVEDSSITIAEDIQEALSRVSEREKDLSRAFLVLRENRRELEGSVARTGPVRDEFKALDGTTEFGDARTKEIEIAGLLLSVYMEHFKRTAEVRRVEEEVVLGDGTRERGEIVLYGGLGGVYKGSALGIVTVPPGAERFHVVDSGLSMKQKKAAVSAFSGSGEVFSIPLDISSGLAVERLGRKRSLWGFVKSGGPVMIPLAIIALLAFLMIVERAFFLIRTGANADGLLSKVIPLVESGNFDKALSFLQGKGPVRRVLADGVRLGRDASKNIEDSLQESMLRELPVLERFLGALAVFAAIAPLLGLLGTVSGMISTFHVITVYGTGNARLLSGGISEALITTEAGLIIAVPILLAHAWLARRVRVIVAHTDRAAMSLTSAIRRSGNAETPGENGESR